MTTTPQLNTDSKVPDNVMNLPCVGQGFYWQDIAVDQEFRTFRRTVRNLGHSEELLLRLTWSTSSILQAWLKQSLLIKISAVRRGQLLAGLFPRLLLIA